MNKTYFVCSDVHGFYNGWMKALNEQGFDINNPDHIIIHCGDLLDRGTQPIECLTFVNNLPKDRKILIKGNHEDLLEKVFEKQYFESHDIHNGTDITVSALAGETIKGETQEQIIRKASENKLIKDYLSSCIDYAEIGKYIFVHGWIPVNKKYSKSKVYEDLPDYLKPYEEAYRSDWRTPLWHDDWKDARWLNGMEMWSQGIKEPRKTIVCGHYHTSWGHSRLHNDGKEFLSRVETFYIDPDTGKQEPHENFNPFIDKGIIALDGCTAYTGKVNCIKIVR